jgi:hypothetical protein
MTSEFARTHSIATLMQNFEKIKKCYKPTGKKNPSLDGEWAQVQVQAHAYVHNCTHIHIFLTELMITYCMT